MPSGNTAIAIYKHLCALYDKGLVSFAHVCCFNLDEFVGIPRDHPRSQHTYMWNNFFSRVDVKRENIFFLEGNSDDLEIECSRFEAELARHGGLDFAFFSTGGDGQVARNEPGSSLKSKTRAKTLATDTVEQLAQRWGVADAKTVPRVTLTVGVGTLLAANEVLVLFSGSTRARSLEAALEKGVNHMFPVSAFQRHPKVIFVCDEDATLELRVKTVGYFKGLEKTTKRLQQRSAAAGNPSLGASTGNAVASKRLRT
mmetsp:Transcript_59536/g.119514  ORF Transcript_59536/g.119514 Transcript_59536/m.119514 type:complete len:256 (+) Transcript_59536:279-1046(+)